MEGLDFDEKVILTLYQKFFEEEYPVPAVTAQHGKPEQMTEEHIKVQKMCYLLNLSGISVGEFNYTWNTYGPYSPSLQAGLRELDQKYDLVKEFYSLKLSDSILFSNDDNSLFWKEDQERIKLLIDTLQIPHEGVAARDWVELLGSMAYISHNVFPHGKFAWINEELVARKKQYKDIDTNKRAWDILLNAHLISPCNV